MGAEIDQGELEAIFGNFLAASGDENLDAFTNGICNAFAFWNFRDIFYKLQDANIARMNKLTMLSNETIEEMGVLYKEYKMERQALIREEKGDIGKDNHIIAQAEEKLTQLRKAKSKDQKTIQSLEENLRATRDHREKLIQSTLQTKFGDRNWKIIKEAETLYLYIHSLIAAFDPGEHLFFHIGDKYVNQHDYIEILKFLPPDILLDSKSKQEAKELKLPEKAFEVAFNFTKNELIELFNNRKAIRNGDIIRLTSSDHAMLLTYINGEFQLLDPGPVKLKDNSAKSLVEKIEERLFTRFKTPSEYQPICISVYTEPDKKQEERPNRVKLLDEMLNKRSKINPNTQAWDGTTSAFMAAAYGHTDTLNLLIEKKADLNIANTSGFTPAYMAAQYGYASSIAIMAAAKADLNKVNKKGDSPVVVAAHTGHANVIKALAECKAKIDSKDAKGLTPARMAAQQGHTEALVELIKAKANINTPDLKGITPLQTLAAYGQLNTIIKLAELKYIDLKKDGVMLAKLAAQLGRPSVVEYLVKSKYIDLTTNGFDLAGSAAAYGHVNVLKSLLENKVNLAQSNNGNTIANIAATSGQSQVIQLLHEAKIDLGAPDQNRSQPLHNAIALSAKEPNEIKHLQVIQALIGCDVLTNSMNFYGKIPIDFATNNQVKAFVTLQLLKSYIEKKYLHDGNWVENTPQLATKQYLLIKSLEIKPDMKWEAQLAKITDMAKEEKPGSRFSLFPPPDIAAKNKYLHLFSKTDTLGKKLSEKLAKLHTVDQSKTARSSPGKR